MSNYTKIDKKFSNKFWKILDRMGRGLPKDRSHHPYGDNCEKTIFIHRTLHKWFGGKYLVIILEKDTGIFEPNARFGDDSIKKKVKSYVFISNIRYSLSYGEELTIMYFDAISLKLCSMTINQSDFNDFEFYEIDAKTYMEVKEMFVDDRPKKAFVFKAWDKKLIESEPIKKSKRARDRQEAHKLLQKENPDLYIFG